MKPGLDDFIFGDGDTTPGQRVVRRWFVVALIVGWVAFVEYRIWAVGR